MRALDVFSIFRGMEGIDVAVVRGIDVVQFALGILFILKVIRQLQLLGIQYMLIDV